MIKKNIIRTMIIAVTVLTAVSCASEPSVINRAQISPAVLLSVSANQKISWTDTTADSPGLLGTTLTKNSDKPEVVYSRTEPLVQFAVQTLLQKLPSSVEMPNALDVISLDSYKEGTEDYLLKTKYGTAVEGWKIYSAVSRSVIRNATEETGAKSAVFITFKFGKTLTDGDKQTTDQIDDEVYYERNGTANADVTMDVVITDTEGKKIFKERYHAVSEKGIRTRKNEYDYKRFVGYFEEPIQKVADSFAASIVNQN